MSHLLRLFTNSGRLAHVVALVALAHDVEDGAQSLDAALPAALAHLAAIFGAGDATG